MNYRDIVVVDDFYENPDKVREMALSTKYSIVKSPFFTRSSSFITNEFIPLFEDILKLKITIDDCWTSKRKIEDSFVLDGNSFNGTFYKASPKIKLNPNHIHHDSTDYVGVVMLSPDCPPEFGTSFWEEKNTQKSFTSSYYSKGSPSDPLCKLPKSNWRELDKIDYKYNRLLLYSGRLFHSINTTTDHERINQLFSFNIQQ